jgi:hypothetical protein
LKDEEKCRLFSLPGLSFYMFKVVGKGVKKNSQEMQE